MGIPLAEQNNIFREFYQLGNPERNRSKGLGLSIMQQLYGCTVVRLSGLLGHTVGLVSVPGRGCLFHVEILLIDHVQLVPPVAAAKLAVPLLQGKQVLVVEDDAEVLDALATLLRRWGATVLTASHQAAALQVAAKQPLALIVSDLQFRC